ncbi:MAG: radical SAM protein [Candidatus Gracilibacteria bacterium]|nr:radical SAM protein [Candidatus Gracilibacteria bacterium]
MDLRIVNTCNNNCLYCLEQSYRNKQKYIDKKIIFSEIENNFDKNITFYGGNPLFHPDLGDIIIYSKSNGFESIGLLTNGFGLSSSVLDNLVNLGLNSIGIYFNCFDEEKHNLIVNGGIKLIELIDVLTLLNNNKIFTKIIIHINKQNINTIYKDILILNKKFGITTFEFINYFPFDRPYDLYKKYLEFSELENRVYINKIFFVIEKLNLKTSFVKFSKSFFGKNKFYYDFNNGVLKQIGEEDIMRLDTIEKPFCFLESRCNNCFIRDNCKFYE